MRFLVVLTGVGPQQDRLVAEIASITRKEPEECQGLIATLPTVIQICTSEEEAREIRGKLVAVGAEATVAVQQLNQDQPVSGERQKQPFSLRIWYSGLQQGQKIQLWVAAGLAVTVVILLSVFFSRKVELARDAAGPAYDATELLAARRVCEGAAHQTYRELWILWNPQTLGKKFDEFYPQVNPPEGALKMVQGFIKQLALGRRCPITPGHERTCLDEEKRIRDALSKIEYHPDDSKTLTIRGYLVSHSPKYVINLVPVEIYPADLVAYTCVVRQKTAGLWLMERLDMAGRTWRY